MSRVTLPGHILSFIPLMKDTFLASGPDIVLHGFDEGQFSRLRLKCVSPSFDGSGYSGSLEISMNNSSR
ncbi:MAG TPA: hypothetical protein VLK78_00725 [Candidatus Angelobacter sp.]|nr:hypothetical protein [Candidatus Angelobacter sp.]